MCVSGEGGGGGSRVAIGGGRRIARGISISDRCVGGSLID